MLLSIIKSTADRIDEISLSIMIAGGIFSTIVIGAIICGAAWLLFTFYNLFNLPAVSYWTFALLIDIILEYRVAKKWAKELQENK